jgi:hypothetical protein
MSDPEYVPHPEYGIVGWYLGGGGCSQGAPQAVQINELYPVIRPHKILASSVGGYNSLKPEDAFSIWENHFYSRSRIYSVHPELSKRLIARLLEHIPRMPHWREHRSMREFYYDCQLQMHNLLQIIRFVLRTLRTISQAPRTTSETSAFNSLSASTLKESLLLARAWGLDELQALLDLTPLLKAIQEVVDLENVLNPPYNRIFLARCGWQLHFFSRYSEESLIRKYPSCFHRMTTWEDHKFALRASSALPPFFEGVREDGKIFRDAGNLNPFPVKYLFEMGCDTVFAFVKNPEQVLPERNMHEATLAELEISPGEYFKYLIKRAKKHAKRNGKRLFIITPQPLHPSLNLLNVTPEALEYTKRVEKEAMQRFLEKLRL